MVCCVAIQAMTRQYLNQRVCECVLQSHQLYIKNRDRVHDLPHLEDSTETVGNQQADVLSQSQTRHG